MTTRERVTNDPRTPPMGLECERWRREVRGHGAVATVMATLGLIVGLCVAVGLEATQLLSRPTHSTRDFCDEVRGLPSYGECYEGRPR